MNKADEKVIGIVGALSCESALPGRALPARIWVVPECPAEACTRLAVGILRQHVSERAHAGSRLKNLVDNQRIQHLSLYVRSDSTCKALQVTATAAGAGLEECEALLRAAKQMSEAPSVLLLLDQKPQPADPTRRALMFNFRNGLALSGAENGAGTIALNRLVHELCPRKLGSINGYLDLYCQLKHCALPQLDWQCFLCDLAPVPVVKTQQEALEALQQLGDADRLAELAEQLRMRLHGETHRV